MDVADVLALADKAGLWYPMGSDAQGLHGRARLMEFASAVEAAAVAAERERWRQAGWVCADGFPALLGHKPLKPGAKLYALPNDWAAHGA